MTIREYEEKDLLQMIDIWNEVVADGIAFPQEEKLDAISGKERLGFVQLGTIPGGFRMKDGHYENICPYYHTL
jgi:hypothetical protein